MDLSIPSEVTRTVLDTGGLTKDEIREAWGLGEGDRPPMGYEAFRRVW